MSEPTQPEAATASKDPAWMEQYRIDLYARAALTGLLAMPAHPTGEERSMADVINAAHAYGRAMVEDRAEGSRRSQLDGHARDIVEEIERFQARADGHRVDGDAMRFLEDIKNRLAAASIEPDGVTPFRHESQAVPPSQRKAEAAYRMMVDAEASVRDGRRLSQPPEYLETLTKLEQSVANYNGL